METYILFLFPEARRGGDGEVSTTAMELSDNVTVCGPSQGCLAAMLGDEPAPSSAH